MDGHSRIDGYGCHSGSRESCIPWKAGPGSITWWFLSLVLIGIAKEPFASQTRTIYSLAALARYSLSSHARWSHGTLAFSWTGRPSGSLSTISRPWMNHVTCVPFRFRRRREKGGEGRGGGCTAHFPSGCLLFGRSALLPGPSCPAEWPCPEFDLHCVFSTLEAARVAGRLRV